MAKNLKQQGAKIAQRLRKLAGRKANLHFEDLIHLANGATEVNEHAVARYAAVMAEFGQMMYHESYLLSRSSVYTARVVLFVDQGDNDWQLVDMQSGHPAFGFDSLETVEEELQLLAVAEKRPAVSAIFFSTVLDDDVPFILYSLFNDSEGNFTAGFGLEEKTRWSSPDAPPVAFMMTNLLEQDWGLERNYFHQAAPRLLKDLAVRHMLAKQDPEAYERYVAEWLQREMREVGAQGARALSIVIDTLTGAIKRMSAMHRKKAEDQVAGLEKSHAKQIQRLNSQVTKAELLSKGSQARADRLNQELKELRKEISSTMAAQPARGSQEASSIGAALDLLFD